jgi:hypothetical protein
MKPLSITQMDGWSLLVFEVAPFRSKGGYILKRVLACFRPQWPDLRIAVA